MEPFKVALMGALSHELNVSTYAKESLAPSLDQETVKIKMQAIFDGSGSKHKAMPKQAHSASPPEARQAAGRTGILFNRRKVQHKVPVPKPVGLARFRQCEVLVELVKVSSEVGTKLSGEDKSEVDMEVESSAAELSETETPSGGPVLQRSTFRRRTYFRER